MTTHRTLLLAPWLGLSLTLAAQETARKPDASVPRAGDSAPQKIERRYAVASDVSIRMSGSVGTLRIIGWTRDSLVIAGSLPKGVRFESAVGGNGSSPARGAKMYIESPYDEATSQSVLELRVPAGARVWIKSGTADVEATGVTGGLDINVIGGSVHVVASPRELQVEAMDASVLIEGEPAWLRAKTATGDITFKGSGVDVGLTTVSGTVRLAGGSVERARVETVTGAIVFAADIAKSGEVALDTHSGPMELSFQAKAIFDLDATSLLGSIDNRFDATRPTPGREGRGQRLVISRGWESARVAVRSFKGTIVIGRR